MPVSWQCDSASGRNRRLLAAIGRSASWFVSSPCRHHIDSFHFVQYLSVPNRKVEEPPAAAAVPPDGLPVVNRHVPPGCRTASANGFVARSAPCLRCGHLFGRAHIANKSALWAFSRSNRSGRQGVLRGVDGQPAVAGRATAGCRGRRIPPAVRRVWSVPVISSPARGSWFRIAPKRSRYSQNCRFPARRLNCGNCGNAFRASRWRKSPGSLRRSATGDGRGRLASAGGAGCIPAASVRPRPGRCRRPWGIAACRGAGLRVLVNSRRPWRSIHRST